MSRLGLLVLLLTAACYQPALGEAPFRCSAGPCPSGYRCKEQICIALGDEDPPIFIGSSVPGPPPQPLWDGERFAVLWQQNEAGLPDSGLHFTRVEPGGARIDRLLSPIVGDMATSTAYHAMTGLAVAAVRVNGYVGALGPRDFVGVFTLDPRDPTVPLATALSCQFPASTFGIGAPSLALGPGAQVTVAITYGQLLPLQITSDNLFAARVDPKGSRLAGGVGDPTAPACGFLSVPTAGRLATEVSLARDAPAGAEEVSLVWRDEQAVHRLLYRELADGSFEDITGTDLPAGALRRVPRSLLGPAGLLLVAERGPTLVSPTPTGSVLRVSRDGARTDEVPLPGGVLDPDLVALDQAGLRFALCSTSASGDLELSYLTTQAGLAIETAIAVPRLSTADVTSCRLAVGDQQLAVAWSERAAAGVVRSYLRLLPRAP